MLGKYPSYIAIGSYYTVKSRVVSKFLWKSRSLFARNCRAKLSMQNKQEGSSFLYASRNIADRPLRSMLVPYIFILDANRRLSWKSTAA